MFPLTLGVFFASGFAALLYQVIWQRLLAIFSGADIYSATVIVAAFMGGLGVGHLAGGHVADRGVAARQSRPLRGRRARDRVVRAVQRVVLLRVLVPAGSGRSI